MPAFEVNFSFRNQTYQSAEAGLKAFSDTLMKDWDGSAKVLSKELRSFLDQVAEALRSRHSGAWPGGTTVDTLSKRSGSLTDAIVGSVEVMGTTMADTEGHIGAPGIVYAGIQEFGGTITAKNGKYLAIPLPAALDSSGLPLQSSPRDWPNTFCAMSKAGNLLIFQRRGTNIVPLYVLKTEVTIPPRLGMRKTLEAGIPYFVMRAMDQMVAAMREAA
jgi:hypothetical protein